MSLYNLINGVNQATFMVLPMFGKHPDEYPRFRDCFVTRDGSTEHKYEIRILTRVGGANRSDYGTEIEELQSNPNYIKDYDDDFDNTFAFFCFSIPEEWQKDFDLLVNGRGYEISKEYQQQMIKVFPKLEEKFKEMFNTQP